MAREKITPSQALLLLIKNEQDPTARKKLKEPYLSGAVNPTIRSQLIHLFNNPVLNNYSISYSPIDINNDPTRSYFETHLAYKSLKNGISSLSDEQKHNFRWHVDNLYGAMQAFGKNEPEKLQKIEHTLQGIYTPDDDITYQEYGSVFGRIRDNKLFSTLPEEQKETITLLIKSSFFAVCCAQMQASSQDMPLNIYNTGIFENKHRGKLLKYGHESTRNQHLGLMKNWMAVPRDDKAQSETVPDHVKASDKATYNPYAFWAQLNFSQLVHPYSNSISGTMLCQLRAIAWLDKLTIQATNERHPLTTASSINQFEQYIRLASSSLLYTMGGHSLFEFFHPLILEASQEQFQHMEHFHELTLDAMWLTHNHRAFESALDKSITYNDQILLHRVVHQELKDTFARSKQYLSQTPYVKSSGKNKKRVARQAKYSDMDPKKVRVDELVQEKKHPQTSPDKQNEEGKRGRVKLFDKKNLLFKKRRKHLRSENRDIINDPNIGNTRGRK